MPERRPGSRPGRIALDVGPIRHQPTGVGVYAGCLAEAVAERLADRLVLLGQRAEAPLDGRLPNNGVANIPFRGRNYHEWLQRHAERDARRVGAALVHYTNASAPLVTRLPFVLTVHDLSLLRYPRFHPALRLATLPFSLAAIARAAAIIVPSQATRAELRAGLRVDGRRVIVVEHAAPPRTPAEAPPDVLLDRLGLSAGKYLLSVGTLEPRKNHVRLVAAFERLAPSRPELQLVLVGSTGWRSEPILRRIEQSPLRERIVLTGYVTDDELATLVGASAAACYVSLYEGYGLPIVEAMGLGTPVVTSRRAAMPQAAGGAAVLVDPHDATDICRGIERALAERDKLVAAGRARAARRDWSDVAGETSAVYDWVLRGSR